MLFIFSLNPLCPLSPTSFLFTLWKCRGGGLDGRMDCGRVWTVEGAAAAVKGGGSCEGDASLFFLDV